jgi:hypothetical protein
MMRSFDMNISEEKFVDTAAYGKIRFIKTKNGWTYQYDRILIDGWENAIKSSADGITPFYLPKSEKPTEEYFPSTEEIAEGDVCIDWYDTYEGAYDNMLKDLSNARIMGTIAVWG